MTAEPPNQGLAPGARPAPAESQQRDLPVSDAARVGVIVASLGRPDHLSALLDRLAAQTHLPVRVALSVADRTDAPPETALTAMPFPIDVLIGSKGISHQRNRGIEALQGACDILAFFDDDYVPSRHAIDGIVRGFAAFPQVDGLSGKLLADGINGPGITSAEAVAMVEAFDCANRPSAPRLCGQLEGLYGCNMAVRVHAIAGLRFDERLPLYSWQEDIDFTSQLRGQKISTDALVGVHCGTKSGRERKGILLGYSQIANPLYLMRKGTMSWRLALRHMTRNVMANHARTLRPEPWVDRRGRVRGNWLALLDLVRGRIDPERILDL